jgi:uncharacterized secreted protein with C-terminal beta-propeller domain
MRKHLWFLSLFATACTSACNPPDRATTLADGEFESDDPGNRSVSGSAAGGSTAATAPEAASDSAEATRAVEEADILKRDGSTLYAVSRYGGLSIVDISNPSKLRILGRFRTQAMPFEMYVREGTVYLMLNDYGHWIAAENDSAYGSWVQSSEILSLDARNPAAIRALASYEVPGDISDSRMVGDVMYVVTSEDGYCWRCDTNTPNTTVTSFKTAPSSIVKSDQLRFASTQPGYSAWKRSVSATNERLYVAGPEWSWSGSGAHNSVIQVVDIKDPSGRLVKGADIPVDGQIQSRWQMDEYQNVLRVVSQRGDGWGANNSINPLVQTFQINSSASFSALGQTDLKLPKPESLRSVRFDGTRAYAITAEREDPLYTIDISNPAAPKQMGELEMPGWIYHMEPRGDRLVAVGYDNQNSEGSLHVSLFDVSNMAKPTMMKRVNFASGWANLAEDQDRIHKSFQVLDSENTILVPFASYGAWNGASCSESRSGIQVIDYTRDNLVLRGVAEQHGQPRRAFMHEGNLFAVSDRSVTSFQMANRDAPAKLGEFALSSPAYTLQAVTPGNLLAQLSNDWWTGEAMVSLSDRDHADSGDVLGQVSLKTLADGDSTLCGANAGAWTSWYQARLFSHGNFVHVVVPRTTYNDSNGRRSSTRTMLVASIDVSVPSKPRIAGKQAISLPLDGNLYSGGGFMDGYAYYSAGEFGSLVGAGSAVVQSGSRLAFIDQTYAIAPWSENGRVVDPSLARNVYVVDTQNPAAMSVTQVALPDSLGATPLLLEGSTLFTSSWNRVASGRVRFYADRVELGATATLGPRTNIPGSLLNVEGNRAVTVDYKRLTQKGTDARSCYESGRNVWFDNGTNACTRVERELALVDFLPSGSARLVNRAALPGQNVSTILAADDRLYVGLYPEYENSNVAHSSYAPPARRAGSRAGLIALGGLREGHVREIASVRDQNSWPLAVNGTKVAVGGDRGIRIYETGANPGLLGAAELRGYGYTNHVLLDNDRAFCAMGEFGVQTVRFAR